MATDYRAILRESGVSLAGLSFSEQNRLIDALHRAHAAGYSAGYWAALEAPSGSRVI